MYKTAQDFAALAKELNYAPAAVAVAWVGSHPAVTAPIIGASNVTQLAGSLASLEVEMTPALREKISALSPEPAPATDRNEERSSVSLNKR